MRRVRGRAAAAAAPALAALALAALPADAQGLLSLEALERFGFVEVTLDTTRFREEKIAVMRIVNRLGVPVEGEIGACDAVFETDDGRVSPLTPVESSTFTAGPRQTLELARLFRVADPARRRPERQAYRLASFPDQIPGCRE